MWGQGPRAPLGCVRLLVPVRVLGTLTLQLTGELRAVSLQTAAHAHPQSRHWLWRSASERESAAWRGPQGAAGVGEQVEAGSDVAPVCQSWAGGHRRNSGLGQSSRLGEGCPQPSFRPDTSSQSLPVPLLPLKPPPPPPPPRQSSEAASVSKCVCAVGGGAGWSL